MQYPPYDELNVVFPPLFPALIFTGFFYYYDAGSIGGFQGTAGYIRSPEVSDSQGIWST